MSLDVHTHIDSMKLGRLVAAVWDWENGWERKILKKAGGLILKSSQCFKDKFCSFLF